MNGFLKPYQIENIKKSYPKGTRIQLDEMDDPYSPIPSGAKGTVAVVDSIGTIHVDWDNGRKLGVVPNEDSFHIIKEQEKMKVLVVEPLAHPYLDEVENSEKAIQGLIGENIDAVTYNHSDINVIYNAKGNRNGSLGNRQLDNGKVVCGTFIICGLDKDGNNISINEAQAKEYTERFFEPEIFTEERASKSGYSEASLRKLEEYVTSFGIFPDGEEVDGYEEQDADFER